MHPLLTLLCALALLQAAFMPLGQCANLDVCSSSCTYTSISAAIFSAKANDVVQVAGGDYTELSITNNKALTIVAQGEVRVFMAPGSFTWLTVTTSTLVLSGSTFVLNNAGLYVTSGGLVQNATLIVNSREATSSAFTITKFFGDRDLMWAQNGDLVINVRSENASISGLRITEGIVWHQRGKVEINLTSTRSSLSGIFFTSGSSSGVSLHWSQQGDVAINGNGLVSALLFYGPSTGAVWNQTGNLAINITTDASSAFADRVVSGVNSYVAGVTWFLSGHVDVLIQHSGTGRVDGILTSDLDVIQTGDLSLKVAAGAAKVYGVWLGQSWVQNGSVDLSVAGTNATGIMIGTAIGWWQQYSPANIVVQGPRSKGVYLDIGAWRQGGRVYVQVDGANSCGVDDGAFWTQLDGAQLDVEVSGSGSLKVCGRATPSRNPTTGGSTTGTPSGGDQSSASSPCPSLMLTSMFSALARLLV